MKIFTLNPANFKLDGGAMFGVVPKSIWQRTNPADENNLCNWATRCLLVDTGSRVVLVDTGIGNKQRESYLKYFQISNYQSFDELLKPLGYQTSNITDVVLTHLHFDHCGGAVSLDLEENPFLTFPNANYWVSEKQWKYATTNPNHREKHSFLEENLKSLSNSGKLNFLTNYNHLNIDEIELIFVDGHTKGLTIPIITTEKGKLAFVSELIPSSSHIGIGYVSSFDSEPVITMKEKESFLQRALEENITLIFQHDFEFEAATLFQTEKGIKCNWKGSLADFLNDN